MADGCLPNSHNSMENLISFVVVDKGGLNINQYEYRSLVINVAIVLDTIWQTHNDMVHRGVVVNSDCLISMVKNCVFE